MTYQRFIRRIWPVFTAIAFVATTAYAAEEKIVRSIEQCQPFRLATLTSAGTIVAIGPRGLYFSDAAGMGRATPSPVDWKTRDLPAGWTFSSSRHNRIIEVAGGDLVVLADRQLGRLSPSGDLRFTFPLELLKDTTRTWVFPDGADLVVLRAGDQQTVTQNIVGPDGHEKASHRIEWPSRSAFCETAQMSFESIAPGRYAAAMLCIDGLRLGILADGAITQTRFLPRMDCDTVCRELGWHHEVTLRKTGDGYFAITPFEAIALTPQFDVIHRLDLNHGSDEDLALGAYANLDVVELADRSILVTAESDRARGVVGMLFSRTGFMVKHEILVSGSNTPPMPAFSFGAPDGTRLLAWPGQAGVVTLPIATSAEAIRIKDVPLETTTWASAPSVTRKSVLVENDCAIPDAIFGTLTKLLRSAKLPDGGQICLYQGSPSAFAWRAAADGTLVWSIELIAMALDPKRLVTFDSGMRLTGVGRQGDTDFALSLDFETGRLTLARLASAVRQPNNKPCDCKMHQVGLPKKARVGLSAGGQFGYSNIGGAWRGLWGIDVALSVGKIWLSAGEQFTWGEPSYRIYEVGMGAYYIVNAGIGLSMYTHNDDWLPRPSVFVGLPLPFPPFEPRRYGFYAEPYYRAAIPGIDGNAVTHQWGILVKAGAFSNEHVDPDRGANTFRLW
jgi:hypothetical protein